MKIIRICLDAMNSICGVMDTLLTSSAVDRAIKAWSGQTKDYNISSLLSFRRVFIPAKHYLLGTITCK
jgi:hypothetical protein